MADVLVTGAFGLIGSEVVTQLVARGVGVVATGRESRTNRRAARRLPSGVEVRWADLAEPGAAAGLVAATSPSAIVHLAAVTPPWTYQNGAAARRVNVDATAALVSAAEACPRQPRFVFASSMAVYGARNPHRFDGLIGAATATAPCESYGLHKLEAEDLVIASRLDWLVLRLGAVLQIVPPSGSFSADRLYVGSALPSDGRAHLIDLRDAATALVQAATTDLAGEVLLVAGDDTLMLRHGDIGTAIAAECGLVDCLPPGLPGDPGDDDAWFTTDWLDTRIAQQRLSFQRHSWPDMLAEVRRQMGWKRFAARAAQPVVSRVLARQSAYRGRAADRYADPWNVIAARFGEPRIDRNVATD